MNCVILYHCVGILSPTTIGNKHSCAFLDYMNSITCFENQLIINFLLQPGNINATISKDMNTILTEKHKCSCILDWLLGTVRYVW